MRMVVKYRREDRCYLGEYLYIYVEGYNVVELSLAIVLQVVPLRPFNLQQPKHAK